MVDTTIAELDVKGLFGQDIEDRVNGVGDMSTIVIRQFLFGFVDKKKS